MENPPPRIRLRPVFVVMAVGCFTLFLAGPLVIAAVVLVFAPVEVSVWVSLAAVAFVAIMGYAMSSSFQWVELDGGIIRGRKLLTRRVVEHQVGDIVSIKPLDSKAMGPLENAVMDALMTEMAKELAGDSGGTVVSEKVLPGEYPGREAQLRAAGSLNARMRYYLVGRRLYGLVAAGSVADVMSPDVDRFFESFKLMK